MAGGPVVVGWTVHGSLDVGLPRVAVRELSHQLPVLAAVSPRVPMVRCCGVIAATRPSIWTGYPADGRRRTHELADALRRALSAATTTPGGEDPGRSASPPP
ncbi:hypothetical protein [Streptomyces sp. NPDC091383]|uniref:hypothetical protein n=1 Tax=Streptomyces sp. NPDC091383 TaxID=3365996 RepID=UPI00381A574C